MQCNYSNVLTNVHDFITSQSVISAKHGLVLSGGCLQADYKHVETERTLWTLIMFWRSHHAAPSVCRL